MSDNIVIQDVWLIPRSEFFSLSTVCMMDIAHTVGGDYETESMYKHCCDLMFSRHPKPSQARYYSGGGSVQQL